MQTVNNSFASNANCSGIGDFAPKHMQTLSLIINSKHQFYSYNKDVRRPHN